MGDTTKAMLPTFCRIFVGFDPDSTVVPADVDTAFGASWDEVGLLAKGGPTQNNTWGQNTKLYARNGELVRVYRDEYSTAFDFSVLELNETTDELVNPGSSPDKIYTPYPVPVMIAFEFQELDVKRRLISANYAEVMQNGATTYAENGLITYPLQAEIFPDPDDTNADGSPCLWIRQNTTDLSS